MDTSSGSFSMNKNATNIDVKRVNRNNILKYIFRQSSTSRQEIASQMRLSMPTVLQNIRELQLLGLIQEDGQYVSTGGRKAAQICSVPGARLAAGLDVTRHHLQLVLIDLNGAILCQHRIRMNYENKEHYYKGVGERLNEFLAEQPQAKDRLLGVGVSLPGIINGDQTLMTDSHVLQVRNLSTSLFAQHIPYPSCFLNDANAAGLGEIRTEAKPKTLVYLSLSDSVGGAVFIDGKLYMGENYRSGEFGHMRLIKNGRRCYCGQLGCMDAYCSSLQLLSLGDTSLEAFFERLAERDEAHLQLWEAYLDNLVLAIVNMRMAFDATIVLGGYMGGWLQPWLEELKKRVAEEDPFVSQVDYIRICVLHYEAAAYGAATRWVDRFLDEV